MCGACTLDLLTDSLLLIVLFHLLSNRVHPICIPKQHSNWQLFCKAFLRPHHSSIYGRLCSLYPADGSTVDSYAMPPLTIAPTGNTTRAAARLCAIATSGLLRASSLGTNLASLQGLPDGALGRAGSGMAPANGQDASVATQGGSSGQSSTHASYTTAISPVKLQEQVG